MKPETLVIRHDILEVLLAADRPLSTAEVCDLVPKYLEVRPCHKVMHGARGDHCYFVRCDGKSDTFLMHVSSGQRGLRELTRFEKLGQVIGYREPGRKAVLWSHPGTERQAEVAMLEELLAQPAASRAAS